MEKCWVVIVRYAGGLVYLPQGSTSPFTSLDDAIRAAKRFRSETSGVQFVVMGAEYATWLEEPPVPAPIVHEVVIRRTDDDVDLVE